MAKFTTYFSGLTQDTDPQSDSDFLMTYDTSAAGIKKILIDDLPFLTSGLSTDTKLDDLAAPDDNTDLDATASAHGLLMKLSGDSDTYLNGDGEWTEPAGGTGTTVEYILVQDQKAKGTQGGTFTQDAWQTRTLNTEVIDNGDNCALASNQMTLEAGTYMAWVTCPAFRVNANQARLANISDTDYYYGSIGYSISSSNTTQSGSIVYAAFTIAAQKVFEVQHRCQSTYASLGYGPELNQGTEVYTQVILLKVA